MAVAYPVARLTEVPPGARKIVEAGGRSIGIFNVRGELHALRNACPHQGGPLCKGSVQGTACDSQPGEYAWSREGEILRCPWHGWEFDLTTGKSLFNPQKVRVRRYDVTLADPDPSVETYPVSVEDGTILVHV
jgi:3-phenylpropionate/trans-cinnamate dioxygenase ferredoxin subunit